MKTLDIETREMVLPYTTVDMHQLHRIALGSLIPAYQREALAPENPNSAEGQTMSGSIGFVDYYDGDILVPDRFAKKHSLEGCTAHALIIESIGVEPNYSNNGYGAQLCEMIEKKALEKRLNFVGIQNITHDYLESIARRREYTLFKTDRMLNAVKKLD